MAKLRYTNSYGGAQYVTGNYIIANRIYLEAPSIISGAKKYYGYYDDDYTVTLKLFSDSGGTVSTLLATGSSVNISSGGIELKEFTITSGTLSAGYYWIGFETTNLSGGYGQDYQSSGDVDLETEIESWSSQSHIKYGVYTDHWTYFTYYALGGLQVLGSLALPGKPINPEYKIKCGGCSRVAYPPLPASFSRNRLSRVTHCLFPFPGFGTVPTIYRPQ